MDQCRSVSFSIITIKKRSLSVTVESYNVESNIRLDGSNGFPTLGEEFSFGGILTTLQEG